MSIHTLPVSPARQHEVRAALEIQDTALVGILALAVESYTSGGLTVVGSEKHSRQLDVTSAYLHSAELVLNKPGVHDHLFAVLNGGECDVEALADSARGWYVDPEAA